MFPTIFRVTETSPLPDEDDFIVKVREDRTILNDVISENLVVRKSYSTWNIK